MFGRVFIVCLLVSGALGFLTNTKKHKARDILPQCAELNQPCNGFPTKCCREMQCYWENGYKLGKNGKCKVCIEEGETCQRDTQCCGELVCQKGGLMYVDGACGVRKPNGARCHEDDNCASDHCHKKFLHVYGTCEDDH